MIYVNLSIVSEFFWILVLKVCICSKFISRKKEDSDLVFTFPAIHEMIGKFNVVVKQQWLRWLDWIFFGGIPPKFEH